MANSTKQLQKRGLIKLTDLEKVKKYKYALRYIENPSLEIQIEAIKQDRDNIKYILNLHPKAQLEIIKEDANFLELSTSYFKELYPEYFLWFRKKVKELKRKMENYLKYELEERLSQEGLECYVTVLENIYEFVFYIGEEKVNFFLNKKETDTADFLIKKIKQKYPEYFIIANLP